MSSVDIDEKNFFVAATRLHPKIYPQSWALIKILNQFFTMKQSYFCNFDIKNEFLDPKNPHVAIFRHQTSSETELQDYFQNSGAESPSSRIYFQKFKLR